MTVYFWGGCVLVFDHQDKKVELLSFCVQVCVQVPVNTNSKSGEDWRLCFWSFATNNTVTHISLRKPLKIKRYMFQLFSFFVQLCPSGLSGACRKFREESLVNIFVPSWRSQGRNSLVQNYLRQPTNQRALKAFQTEACHQLSLAFRYCRHSFSFCCFPPVLQYYNTILSISCVIFLTLLLLPFATSIQSYYSKIDYYCSKN